MSGPKACTCPPAWAGRALPGQLEACYVLQARLAHAHVERRLRAISLTLPDGRRIDGTRCLIAACAAISPDAHAPGSRRGSSPTRPSRRLTQLALQSKRFPISSTVRDCSRSCDDGSPRCADRIPEQRWAAVFVSVAHELLTAATHPLGAVRLLLRWDLEDVLRACEARSDFGPHPIEGARSIAWANNLPCVAKWEVDRSLGLRVFEEKVYSEGGACEP